MNDPSALFQNEVKCCKNCGRLLAEEYPDDLCPFCKENELFDQVREYVRAHDVTEYQVADYFHLPLDKVKQWIREGRIEYKDKENAAITGMFCARCGAKVNFGTLCPKCLKLMNESRKGYAPVAKHHKDSDRMRFLDEAGRKQSEK